MTYNFVARYYDWLETCAAGRKMQQCRNAFLSEAASAKNILLLGEGTGRFLITLLRSNPTAHITCLDSSARMLAIAKKRVERAGMARTGLRFIHADILNWRIVGAPYDLVVSNFFFDNFSEDSVGNIVRKIASATAPAGGWIVSDFSDSGTGLAGLRIRLILKSLYLFFGLMAKVEARRLTPPDAALLRNGFDLKEQKRSDWGLFQSARWTRQNDPRQTQFARVLPHLAHEAYHPKAVV
jgi:ubiquinone/menaquinone biosynthesis C-methylase UbiE